MVLPLDPIKREVYLHNLRTRSIGKIASPETKLLMSQIRKNKTKGEPKSAIYEFTCLNCNTVFKRTGKRKYNYKYCCEECAHTHMSGENHPRFKKETVVCKQCGVDLLRSPAFQRGKWGNFCSTKCKGDWMSEHIKGAKHPQWQGGISYEPYCPLFNETFKERVRAFFDNTCVLCGKQESECNEHLHVHHVVYNKLTCCDDSQKLFVVLCRSCHTKTNHNREKYEEQFKQLIDTKYQGRSYFTVEEWELLNSTNPQYHSPAIPAVLQAPIF